MARVLDKNEAEVLIRNLREQLHTHNYRYHVLQEPIVADSEYDMLYRQLADLEDRWPELIADDSPTRRVGGVVAEGFERFMRKGV